MCYFSHSLSLFLCLFTLPPTVCSHFIKSEGNSTGSHCWGSTPIRRLLSSQISHVLAFKCRKFTPDFSELCPEVWRAHQTGKEKVFLSIPSSQPLLKKYFFSSFHPLPNQVTACKIAADFTGLKSRGDGMLAERAWHK